MSKVQSEAVLENNMIRSLVDLGYQQVTIKDEESLLENFREQVYLHNKERLNNIPLSNSEFDRLLISLGGKGIFNSAYNLRQLQTITRDDGKIAALL